MKYIFMIIFTMFAAVAYADVGQLGNRVQVLNIHPVATVSASGDSSAIDLNNYAGNCAAIIDANKASGDGTTALDLKLTNASTSGGSYSDISGASFTTVSGTASVQKIVFNKDSAKRYIKLNKVLAGGSAPSFLLSAKILCDKKYRQ